MRKKVLKIFLFIFFIFLISPFSVSAWSWQDMFKSTEGQAEELPSFNLSSQQKMEVENKYNNWKQGLETNSLETVLEDERNFQLTEKEANYLLYHYISQCQDPYFSEATLDFKGDFIRLEAYLLKPLTGNVTLDIAIYEEGDAISLTVLKAKYRNISIPPFLINKVLNKSFLSLTQLIENYINSLNSEGNNLEIHLSEEVFSLYIKK
ncbi:MAG: hypothetical protein K9M44_03265 [Candidatus Pacebacteria bacterium]|nr:hypothetical protein [Candidatus Paceibacterota bacterium]